MTTQPRFSIIVPVYNSEKYLRQCIESIVSQPSNDFELLLVDDGSTDSSPYICDEYSQKYSNIKVIHRKNSGVSKSRNIGLDNACGKYILFIDSDDYLKPRAFDIFNEILSKYPDADYIKNNYYLLIDGVNEKTSIWKSDRSKHKGILSGNDMVAKILRTEFFVHNSLFNMEFVKKNNLRFHEDMVILEDVVFLLELCAHNPKCVFNPIETLTYRFSEGSLLRSRRNFKKISSLAQGSFYVKQLVPFYKDEALEIVRKRYVEMAITSMYCSSIELEEKEGHKIVELLSGYHKTLPMKCRSIKHMIGVLLFNIHPNFARRVLSLLKSS